MRYPTPPNPNMPEPFGDLRDVYWDDQAQAACGFIVMRDTAQGRHFQALLVKLEEQGMLHEVALAPELDIELDESTGTVRRIARCHGVYLVARSAVGGKFAAADDPPPSKPGKRGDVDLIVGFNNNDEQGVTLISCPATYPMRRNPDGTLRVLEAMSLAPDRLHLRRLERFARTERKSWKREAFTGKSYLDRADDVERVLLSTLDHGSDEAERDGGLYHDFGIMNLASRRKAERRLAGRARTKATKQAARESHATHQTAKEPRDVPDKIAAAEQCDAEREAIAAVRAIFAAKQRRCRGAMAKGAGAAEMYLTRLLEDPQSKMTLQECADECQCAIGTAGNALKRIRKDLLKDPRCAAFRKILGK